MVYNLKEPGSLREPGFYVPAYSFPAVRAGSPQKINSWERTEIGMIRIGRLASLFIFLVFLGFVPARLAAAEIQIVPAQAAKFIHDLGKRIVALLDRYPSGDAPHLQAQLRDIIRESFDLDRIGRFALGRAWESATDVQQKEYLNLFALWTADNYARRLGGDRGGSLAVLGAQPGINATDALVHTQINRANGTSITVNLRVHDNGRQIRIIDVAMGRVSMAVTQRDDFASVIGRKGLNALISDLRKMTVGLYFVAAER